MRRFGAMLGVVALAALVVGFRTATATSPSGTVVHNPDGSYTLTATASERPAVLDLPDLLSSPVAIGQLVALSADVSYDAGGCAGAFEFEPVEASAFLGLGVAVSDPAVTCASGSTGNLIAGTAHRFDPNRDGGSVLDFAQLTSRYGAATINRPRFVLDPPTGTVTLTISDVAVQTAPSTSPSVTVALCSTTDADELARGADYTSGAANCPSTDTRLDPRGVLITAATGDVSRYLGAATSAGGLYPAPLLTAGESVVFGEGLRGTQSAAITDPSDVAITIYAAAEPPTVAATNINATTGVAIAGQSFALVPQSCTGAPIATTVADATGRLALRPPVPGDYCVVPDATADGYDATVPVPASGSTELGDLPSTPRDTSLTARFTTTEGATVAPVCAALFEKVTAARSTGPVAGSKCDHGGAIAWTVPVGQVLQIEVQQAPDGVSFGAPPAAAAVPADLWSVGLMVTDAAGGPATTGVLEIVYQRCLVQATDQVETSVRVVASATIRPKCKPGHAGFELDEAPQPHSGRSLTITTGDDGRATARLPVTDRGRFPRGPYRFADTLRARASGASVDVGITGGTPTVVEVTERRLGGFPSLGGLIPQANPTPHRASPPPPIAIGSSDVAAQQIARHTSRVPSRSPAASGPAASASAPASAAPAPASSAVPPTQRSPAAASGPDNSGPSAVVIAGIAGAVLLAIFLGVVVVVRSGGAHSEE